MTGPFRALPLAVLSCIVAAPVVFAARAAWAAQPVPTFNRTVPGAAEDSGARPWESSLDGSSRVLVRLEPGARLVWVNGHATIRPPGSGDRGVPLASRLDGLGAWSVEPAIRATPQDQSLASAVGLDRDLLVRVSGPGRSEAASLALATIDGVASSMPEPVGELLEYGIEIPMPTDPLIPNQWAISNTGQVVQGSPGVPGADANVMGAWSQAAGVLKSVVVAVIDSGVAPGHPDLDAALVPGWNVVNLNTQTGDDVSSHGTHIAGIIAGEHNASGIAGICPTASIMPVKVTNLYGSTGASWVASGVVWAADHGARILNISIGFNTDSAVLRSAIQYASGRGCLIVCSAGNVPTSPIVFPARYPEAIAVGATDNRDQRWSASATGAELDLVAPGVDILSTWHKATAPNTYSFQTGTSQAAPHVAGVAALLWAVGPVLTPSQVRLMIEASARDLGAAGRDPQFGAGRLDALGAMALTRAFLEASVPAQGACRVDMNRDGVISSSDYFLYMDLFAEHDPRADFAPAYGVVDAQDFLQFAMEYAGGCRL